jgi:hypothetical protein
MWLMTATSGGPCEQGNELSVSTEGGKFSYYISDYKNLKKGSTQWSWLAAIRFGFKVVGTTPQNKSI